MNNINLVKYAKELADKKHPDGYGKKELIACSKEVFGGFGASPHGALKTLEDVNHKRNYFAFIDGHYPAGMDGCTTVGISGGCGLQCPVFKNGECKEHWGEMQDQLIESDEFEDDEKLEIMLKYL